MMNDTAPHGGSLRGNNPIAAEAIPEEIASPLSGMLARNDGAGGAVSLGGNDPFKAAATPAGGVPPMGGVPAMTAALAALLLGCGAPPPGPAIAPEEGTGKVVATVDGVPLRASLVARASAETGLPPREALAGLVEEAVLAAAAQERGLPGATAVVAVWEKALVQRLLEREVEGKAPPVTLEDLRRAYVEGYEGKGVLLEDAWRDIRDKLRAKRRGEAYNALLGALLAKYRPAVFYGRLEPVK